MNATQFLSMASAYMAPAWFVYSLAGAFFAGAVFYLYRLLFPAPLKALYGYHDWQNEVGHGICMLAMASAMAPVSLQLPSLFWAISLTAVGIFFLFRAITWGRKLPYNKWWWDWAHVGMLLGMAIMFMPISVGYFVYALAAFWLWFASYYAWELYQDFKKPKALYIGSDLAHFAMGIVMLIMTVFPMALMPPGGDMSMPGMICSESMK